MKVHVVSGAGGSPVAQVIYVFKRLLWFVSSAPDSCGSGRPQVSHVAHFFSTFFKLLLPRRCPRGRGSSAHCSAWTIFLFSCNRRQYFDTIKVCKLLWICRFVLRGGRSRSLGGNGGAGEESGGF